MLSTFSGGNCDINRETRGELVGKFEWHHTKNQNIYQPAGNNIFKYHKHSIYFFWWNPRQTWTNRLKNNIHLSKPHWKCLRRSVTKSWEFERVRTPPSWNINVFSVNLRKTSYNLIALRNGFEHACKVGWKHFHEVFQTFSKQNLYKTFLRPKTYMVLTLASPSSLRILK